MKTTEKVKAFHFYLDYLRTHKHLKDLGVVGRDRKMISWAENERGGNKSFVTVCCRLLRSALEHYFPDWTIKKVKGTFAYEIGSSRGRRSIYNPETRRYERAQIPQDSEQYRIFKILSERNPRYNHYGTGDDRQPSKYHRELAKIDKLNEELSKESPRLFFRWDKYTGNFTLTLSADECGLFKAVKALPKIREVFGEILEAATNLEALLEKAKREREATMKAYKDFAALYKDYDPSAVITGRGSVALEYRPEMSVMRIRNGTTRRVALILEDNLSQSEASVLMQGALA